ncbi:MAG: M4 family metallopeptidase [Parachlamydia sp.]|nr:M4 family metallopeptidase [Parachlamydia sp.]
MPGIMAFGQTHSYTVPNLDTESLEVLSSPSIPVSICVDPQITIYSMVDGRVICSAEECNDPQAERLYHTAVKTYDFFRDRFQYCGIDGNGLIAPMHLYWDEQNAAWTCSLALSGKQCSWRFNHAFVREKIVPHEWMHGILDHLWPHSPFGESGALDEAISNINAIACYRWNHRRSIHNISTWRISTGSETLYDLSVRPSMPLIKLRPEESPSQANDMGYVHGNSLIISYAFYRAVQNLYAKTGNEDFAFNGPLDVVWNVIPELDDNESFEGYATKSVEIALRTNRIVAGALHEAFHHVGIVLPPLPLEDNQRARSPLMAGRQRLLRPELYY